MPDKVSNIGPGILKSGDMDAIIFTLAESYFNQAEARLKGLNNHRTQRQGTLSRAESLLRSNTLDLMPMMLKPIITDAVSLKSWDYSSNKIQAIITQKWIAVNGITAEQSWFDYSRTGYPSGLPIPLNYTGSADRPVRLFYPSGEYSANGDNIPAQPNAFSAKIFWAN